MSNRGTRNRNTELQKKISYALKSKIRNESFRDNRIAETVCRTSHLSLVTFGYEQWKEFFSTTLVPDIDCGVVLSDSRGRGVFQ